MEGSWSPDGIDSNSAGKYEQYVPLLQRTTVVILSTDAICRKTSMLFRWYKYSGSVMNIWFDKK